MKRIVRSRSSSSFPWKPNVQKTNIQHYSILGPTQSALVSLLNFVHFWSERKQQGTYRSFSENWFYFHRNPHCWPQLLELVLATPVRWLEDAPFSFFQLWWINQTGLLRINFLCWRGLIAVFCWLFSATNIVKLLPALQAEVLGNHPKSCHQRKAENGMFEFMWALQFCRWSDFICFDLPLNEGDRCCVWDHQAPSYKNNWRQWVSNP